MTASHKPLVLSGMQPTNTLHLGNYLGALKNWVKMQEQMPCLFCVVDMHAITADAGYGKPQELAQATREVAAAYIAQLDGAKTFSKPVATKIEPGQAFYPAEGYHQDYLTLHPNAPYIAHHDMPKLDALKRVFPAMWRADPVLVAKEGLK